MDTCNDPRERPWQRTARRVAAIWRQGQGGVRLVRCQVGEVGGGRRAGRNGEEGEWRGTLVNRGFMWA